MVSPVASFGAVTPGPALASVILAVYPASCDTCHLAWPFTPSCVRIDSCGRKTFPLPFVDEADQRIYSGSDGNETERESSFWPVLPEDISEAAGKENTELPS